tara:strand:+ start:12060 stop:13049 length:990 start_codon:yes stop_codon:yes gene_type:complete
MIVYDMIIKRVNPGGGIDVLFDALIKNCQASELDIFCIFGEEKKRSFSRYLDVKCPLQGIFHSTYYRLPQERKKFDVVTTVHDFTYEKYSSGLKRFVHTSQKSRAIEKSDKVICVSNNTKLDLIGYFPDIDEDSISVVYNGVSDFYYPMKGGGAENDFILYVGGRSGYKNFISLVLALAESLSYSLVCVGGGGFSKAEIEFMNRYIPLRYRHAGYVSEYDLNYLYNTAHCLVYPSLYEGFGIPVVESFKAGCPVVATESSSITEIAAGAAFLTKNASAEELLSGILAFENSKYRSFMISEGLKIADRFSWETCFQKTLEVYKSCSRWAE